MRPQEDREEQAVLIGTALAVFAVVLAAEALGLWLLHIALDLHLGSAILGSAIVIAGTFAVAKLVRAERD